MPRVLVTGGAGFVGSHLVERLLAEGWTVSVLDDFNDFYPPSDKRRNLAAHAAHPSFRLVEGDILDEPLVGRVLDEAKPEVVVHLAARAGVRPSIVQPLLYEAVNVRGTLVLLEGCRKAGVARFVFGSSSSVYGTNSKLPFSEEDPIRQTISPYAATKAAGEQLCHAYAHVHGLRCVALRLFTVYGPRQRPDLAIHRFTRLLLAGQEVPLYGDGSSRRDYTYVDDIVDGIVAAMGYDRRPFALFNLGNSTPVALADLLALLEEATDRKARILRLPDQAGDMPVTFADISRARDELGYRPRHGIREGIARFVAWYRAERAPAAAEA